MCCCVCIWTPTSSFYAFFPMARSHQRRLQKPRISPPSAFLFGVAPVSSRQNSVLEGPTMFALWGAVASVVIKEALYRVCPCRPFCMSPLFCPLPLSHMHLELSLCCHSALFSPHNPQQPTPKPTLIAPSPARADGRTSTHANTHQHTSTDVNTPLPTPSSCLRIGSPHHPRS